MKCACVSPEKKKDWRQPVCNEGLQLEFYGTKNIVLELAHATSHILQLH